MYFENASRDTTDAYLAEGLTEAVITQLGRIDRISITSRSAVRRYRGTLPDPRVISRTLGVAYLVTGSVQRAGHELRVTIELARASTGTRLWGEQFSRSDDSLFALQDDLAGRVAQGVAGRLLPGERRAVAAVRATGNPQAYQHFLHGNYFLARRTSTALMRATDEYGRAVALDSGYVSALARIGLAYALRLDWQWDPSGAPPADSLLERGLAAADAALRRDSLNSDAWLSRGYLNEFRHPRTWEGVLAAFQRAVTLDPRNAEAWHQLGDAATNMDDDSTAVTALRRALAIDPERPITLRAYSTFVLPYEARRLLDSALVVDPGFALARRSRSDVELENGDTAAARRDLEASPCEPCPPDMWPVWTAWDALSLRLLGDTEAGRVEAESVLARLRPDGPIGWRVAQPLAVSYLQRGDTARALDLLERISPRGVILWSDLAGRTAAQWRLIASSERFQRLVDDARPPWARATPQIRDLPIPPAARRRWEGSYTGLIGRVRVTTQGDSLVIKQEGQAPTRLLYQGGDTLIPAANPDIRLVFDGRDKRSAGFTATTRKRIFPFTRVQ